MRFNAHVQPFMILYTYEYVMHIQVHVALYCILKGLINQVSGLYE